MKFINIIQFLLVLLSSKVFANYISSNLKTNEVIPRNSSFENNRNLNEILPELIGDLSDFVDLIPITTLDALVAKYYVFDGGFRSALSFVKSNEFKVLLKKLQQKAEVIEILDYLHMRAATNEWESNMVVGSVGAKSAKARRVARAIDEKRVEEMRAALVPLLAILLINERPMEVSSNHLNEYSHELGSFTHFVDELLAHLPRDQYVAMIKEKRQNSALFEQFYEALRSPQLRGMVQKAMKSPNLADVMHTLSSHSVDANGLEPIVFKVISWGPAV